MVRGSTIGVGASMTTGAAVTTAAAVAFGTQAGAVSEGRASRAPPQPVRHLKVKLGMMRWNAALREMFLRAWSTYAT
jgi:hypothetical protein